MIILLKSIGIMYNFLQSEVCQVAKSTNFEIETLRGVNNYYFSLLNTIKT